jgi:hypothetical protein
MLWGSYVKLHIKITKKRISLLSFTGAPFLTTITLQHAVFNQKCFSSSLECPYNIQQSPQINLPNLPSLPPQKEDTGKSNVLKIQATRRPNSRWEDNIEKIDEKSHSEYAVRRQTSN